MNANIQIKAKHFFEQTAGWSFLLMMLSFPLSLFVNNLFATVFLIAFGLYLVLNKTFFVRDANSVSSIYFLVFSLPFLLTLTGSLYTSNISGALNLIEKTAPVLFFAFYAVYHHQWFESKIKKALWL